MKLELDDDSLVELVSRAKRGDAGAFEELYKKTNATIWRKSYSILRDFDLATDAVQEVYEIVFTSLSELKSDNAFISWIHTITRRVSFRLIEFQRELPLEVRNLELFIRERSENPLDLVLKKEELREVSRAVNELPKRQRDFVVKKYYRGMKLGDIAKQENCPLGTVKSGLNCAKRSVKEKIIRRCGIK